MRRIFKKNKSLFISTTTIKNNKTNKNKKVFFNLSFISCSYYYYNTIKQSTLLFSSMFYLLKRCQEKFFKNILSLLAGKSEQICTAFPLTTFSRQKYARLAFKKLSAKTLIQFLVQKFLTLTSQKFLNEQYFPVTCRAEGYVARQDSVCCAYYLLPAQQIFTLRRVEVSSILCNTKISWTSKW